MSSTLYFRKTPQLNNTIGYTGLPLKGIFIKRFSEHGSDIVTLCKDELGWLCGVRDAIGDNKDRKLLDKIIEILENDKTVDMWYEY